MPISEKTPLGRGLAALAVAFTGVVLVAGLTIVLPSFSAQPAAPAPVQELSLPVEPLPARAVAHTLEREVRWSASGVLPAFTMTIPVAGITRDQLVDTFASARDQGDRVHQAIDILAPVGTPVLAAADGVILRLAENRLGGRTVYQAGPGGRYVFYYAHLDAYADSLAAGQPVRRGQVIGYVGTTGNAHEDAPHLHFAIWGARGVPVNPYDALR